MSQREFWIREQDTRGCASISAYLKPEYAATEHGGKYFHVREVSSYDHEKDEALCEAFNAFQEITEYGVTDCSCCQHHERVANGWLKKYWTPLNARNLSIPAGTEQKDEK